LPAKNKKRRKGNATSSRGESSKRAAPRGISKKNTPSKKNKRLEKKKKEDTLRESKRGKRIAPYAPPTKN